MGKVRSFSIYLLKESYNATNTLKEDHSLDDQIAGNDLPEDATLYVLDNSPMPPWWKNYFGIQKGLQQSLKGAIVFLPVEDKTFAITFAHVFHNLKDTSYEYDFGLRVTLNCVDPEKLKSTDILEPSGAKRRRTQVPVDSDLTCFDFVRDSTILKSLTGKVKDEHKKLFKHSTGVSNICISSDVTPNGLPNLCAKLLKLYKDDSFRTAFPEIQNIFPVRDPSIIEVLNNKLMDAFREKSDDLALAIPEMINYQEGFWATFMGAGAGLVYDDVFLARYYEYLEFHSVDLNTMDMEALKKHYLALADEEGQLRGEKYSIFKCLIYDTVLDGENETYHLCEGSWYLVDNDYIKKLSNYLDPLCADSSLGTYIHNNEGAFNQDVADASDALICLDKANIAPKGQKQVEPCDIFELKNSKAILHHVKISTLSAKLSHLFNQGVNSIKLIRSDSECMNKMKGLVASSCPNEQQESFTSPLDNDSIKVVFEIITHKDKEAKSLNLPLFSRISLMRSMKDLKMMGIEMEYCFIKDHSPNNPGKIKKRKPREKPEEAKAA